MTEVKVKVLLTSVHYITISEATAKRPLSTISSTLYAGRINTLTLNTLCYYPFDLAGKYNANLSV